MCSTRWVYVGGRARGGGFAHTNFYIHTYTHTIHTPEVWKRKFLDGLCVRSLRTLHGHEIGDVG